MQYRVTSPLQHDGRTIPLDTLIDLPIEAAAPLLDSKTIEPVPKPFAQTLNPILRSEKE